MKDTTVRPMSSVKVSTNEFVRSHGKEPRGFGTWMFEFRVSKGDAAECVAHLKVTSNFAPARRRAKELAQTMFPGTATIELVVLP